MSSHYNLHELNILQPVEVVRKFMYLKALTISRSEEGRAFECVRVGEKGNTYNKISHDKHWIWIDLCSIENE